MNFVKQHLECPPSQVHRRGRNDSLLIEKFLLLFSKRSARLPIHSCVRFARQHLHWVFASALLLQAERVRGAAIPPHLSAGAEDAEPALAAALAAGPVTLPCGTYRLDRTLEVSGRSFVLQGDAEGCVILAANFPDGDIIHLTGTERPRLAGFTITATVQRRSGAVIHAVRTYGATFESIALSGPHGGDGFLIEGANTTHIDKFDCRPPLLFAIGTFAAGACIHGTGNFTDLYFSAGNSASWHYGLQATHGSGLYGARCDFVNSGNGITFDPSAAAGQSVYGVQLSEMLSDTSLGDNWLFAGDGPLADLQIEGAWASSSGTANGIAVSNPRLDGLQLSIADALGNHANGVALVAGRDITLTGLHAQMNSRAGPGLYDGLYIGPAADRVIVVGSRFGQGGIQAAQHAANTQRYGINVPGGNPSGQMLTFMGNQAFGNLSGAWHFPPDKMPNRVSNIGNTGD